MRRAVFAVLLLALWAPAGASAAWFGATPIDGPNPAVIGLGGVDVARDGTGALVYLRADGVFLSRLAGGVWQPPQRVDTGIPGPPRAAKVAAVDGGRLLLAWIDGAVVYGMQVAGPGGLGRPVALGSGADSVDVGLGVDAAGWVVWSGAGNVRAGSARGGRWTVLPGVLDINPAQDASGPRVAVGADGSGLMTWTESGADGRTHVYARRLTPLMSIPPSDLTLPGGSASEPDVDLEDDANFGWVVFAENGHSYARHFLGSTFDPPVALDGGSGSDAPRVDFDPSGVGQAVVAGGRAVLVDRLRDDVFAAPARLDAGGSVVPPGPVSAASALGDEAVVWLSAPLGGVPGLRGRYAVRGGAFQPEVPLTASALGAVAAGDYDIAADRVGDTAVAVAQGADGARTIAAAVWDRPPSAPTPHTVRSFAGRGRPRFRWIPHRDLWGAQRFEVQVDGRAVGTTTRNALVPARPLRGGRHRWRVVAIDRRGQRSPSATQLVRIAHARLEISVRITGSRRAGRALRIAVRVRTRRGVRLDHVTVSYGDGTPATRRAVSVHRYRRAGTYRLLVRAVDSAGHVVRQRVTLRIA